MVFYTYLYICFRIAFTLSHFWKGYLRYVYYFVEIKVLDVHVFIMVLSEKKSKGKERTTMSMSKYRPFRHYLGIWGYSTFGTSKMIWHLNCPKLLQNFSTGWNQTETQFDPVLNFLFSRNSYGRVSVTFAEYKIDKQSEAQNLADHMSYAQCNLKFQWLHTACNIGYHNIITVIKVIINILIKPL